MGNVRPRYNAALSQELLVIREFLAGEIDCGATETGHRVPEYVTRQRAATELCMSDDTFDKYVREGILPSPKRRGGLVRWKWSEVVAALDGSGTAVVKVERDEIEESIERAKAARRRAA